MTVVIPTLAADEKLRECIDSLARQTLRDFEVVIVDNSGTRRVRREGVIGSDIQVIENDRNLGFGAAVNQGIRASTAPYVDTLNDDAAASPK